ncbi:hypothetical protein BH11MYX3_BH11MYX3_22070 [soil metagenome]
MRFAVLVALALGGGCGGGDGGTGTPDASSASDALPAGDAPAPLHGLLVAWRAMPMLPGMLKPDLIVTSATFQVGRLQVIGDNGQPRTMHPLAIAWTDQGGGDPPTIAFPAAPSGLYSQITIALAHDQGATYEIFGTVKIGGTVETFHIHDDNDIDVNITGYTVSLPPGGDATAIVKLDLKDAVDSINFGQLPMVGGMRDLGPNDPQSSSFRDKLESSFRR